MFDPYWTSYLGELGRKTRSLITKYEREITLYLSILKERTAVEHKRIDIIVGESLPIVLESLEYFDPHFGGGAHRSSYRLGIKVIDRRRYDGYVVDAEAQAASHDGTHITCIRRIDEHDVVTGLELNVRLLYHTDNKAVLFLREDIKRLLLRAQRYLIVLTDLLYLGDRLLRPERRMKDDGPDLLGAAVKKFHNDGGTERICDIVFFFVSCDLQSISSLKI